MNPRISGWFNWRLIAILALLVGVATGSNLSAQTPTLTNSLTGMVKLELGGTQQGTLTLSPAPSMDARVTLLSSDTDVVKLSASGSAADAQDRVTLTFTSGSHTDIPYTIHVVAAGRADIYQMMVMDGTSPTFTRLQVEVMQSKSAGGITIRSTAADPWFPLYWAERTPPSTFDHVFGDTDQFTYEVALDGVTCPATVEIRGTLHGYYMDPPIKRLGIHEAGQPRDDPATNINSLSLDLAFAAGECSTPKSVTIYGLQDPDTYYWYVRTQLSHTLVQGEHRTNGPKFGLFQNELQRLNLSFSRVTNSALSTSTWFKAYNHTKVIAPRQGAGQAAVWAEFCVFVHTTHLLEKTEDGIAKVRNKYNRSWPRLSRYLYLPELTLVPAQHANQFWWYNPDDGSYVPYRPFPDPDANGLLLPFEIERYTGDVNGGDRCQSTMMMMNHRRNGVWELVYSGGPSASDAASIDEWRTNVKPTVKPLVIEADDYGKFINLRIRGVNGVNPNMGSGYDVRTPSGPSQWFKLRALEMLGAHPHGSFGVYFVDEVSGGTGD